MVGLYIALQINIFFESLFQAKRRRKINIFLIKYFIPDFPYKTMTNPDWKSKGERGKICGWFTRKYGCLLPALIGALYIRSGVTLKKLMHGAGHER